MSNGFRDLRIKKVFPTFAVDYLDDHALMEGVRAGQELAFQELVNRYCNPITNFVYRMLGDYDRAMELAQETFLRIYMNVERYQASHAFSTYIYRIALNLALSELRKRKNRHFFSLSSAFSTEAGEEQEWELPARYQISAEEAVIADQRRQAVTQALASLPLKYRTAVILRDIEERTYEEVSEILGLPVGTAKSRINRGRQLLKRKLEKYI